MRDTCPLVMHLVYRFDVGGLENGVVNLINRMDPGQFRHAVVALTRCEPAFCERVTSRDVEFISLGKGPGHATQLYTELYRLFRAYRPAVVHTRNLAALETVVPAWLAGVPVRVHGEHGWDLGDLEGRNRKNRLIRRLYRPFVSHYVALSEHLENYLCRGVGVPRGRVARICNGVDHGRFHPQEGNRELPRGMPFRGGDEIVLGTVGRLQRVKDHATLISAFGRLCRRSEEWSRRLRLVIAGDGPLREELAAQARESGLEGRIWLPGERSDVAQIMRAVDVFVLPSLAEGISNTILEAMASGIPVVATDVGGNSELVANGQTGALVPPRDPAALGNAMERYCADAQLRRHHGENGRRRCEDRFSLERMVADYSDLYEALLSGTRYAFPAVQQP